MKIPIEPMGKIYLEEIVIAQYAQQHNIDFEKLLQFLTSVVELDEELAKQLDAASGMSEGYWLALQADMIE